MFHLSHLLMFKRCLKTCLYRRSSNLWCHFDLRACVLSLLYDWLLERYQHCSIIITIVIMSKSFLKLWLWQSCSCDRCNAILSSSFSVVRLRLLSFHLWNPHYWFCLSCYTLYSFQAAHLENYGLYFVVSLSKCPCSRVIYRRTLTTIVPCKYSYNKRIYG
jgi:hypothetical protein